MKHGSNIPLNRRLETARIQQQRSKGTTGLTRTACEELGGHAHVSTVGTPNIYSNERRNSEVHHCRQIPNMHAAQHELSDSLCGGDERPLGLLDDDCIIDMPDGAENQANSADAASFKPPSTNAIKLCRLILVRFFLTLPRKGVRMCIPFTRRKLICAVASGATASSLMLSMVMYRLERSVSEIAGVVAVVLALGTLYVMVAMAG